MLRLIITYMILLASCVAVAQNPYGQTIRTQNDRFVADKLKASISNPYNNTWNIGSAKKLEGRTYLLEVWLTAPNTKWDYNEMCRMQGQINEATSWITREAARFGKKVEFVAGTFAGDGYKGIQMANLPKSYAEAANSGSLLTQALRIIGYNGNNECYNQLITNYNCHNVIVLVMINNAGWSCTNNYSEGHNLYGYQNYFLENAFIFTSSHGYPTSSRTIAHEILHMFGAWDLYDGQVRDDWAQWAKSKYPNAIMIQVSSPIDQLYIDPLNAWLLGLSNQYEDWYMSMQRLDDATVND